MVDDGHGLEFQNFLVRNLPLQWPVAFAKARQTLDLLGGGRFVAGLSAGGFLDSAQAMGAPARTPGQSLEALEEAIVIMRAWWGTTGVPRLHGRHYALEGARPGPKPALVAAAAADSSW
jgi:alkanesulfonate monooxygenase SsuD/methylene tetrahydromethanopterin reductase-like flavin-dependent oxidoreductase (luciferase family)